MESFPPHPSSLRAPQAPAAAPAREAPPPLPPVLEMIAVAVPALKHPGQIVLEDVNWLATQGDFWAIGGLQGSGKSDFIAVAAGILPPVHGTFKAFGGDLRTGFEQERVATQLRIGVVFDGGQLLYHLSVADNITLPMRYHRNCRIQDCADRAQALLELMELTACADEYPGNLAPQRRQRVGLARALALSPAVLLLDNPLGGLDPRDGSWWRDMLGHLAAGHPLLENRPLTLVVTADDLRPWSDYARQYAALRGRHLVHLAKPALQDSAAMLAELQEHEPAPVQEGG
jgi:ABC-type transporter Mla maintaining outer membrane lipid asymmetry ATPase subunit MlaF